MKLSLSNRPNWVEDVSSATPNNGNILFPKGDVLTDPKSMEKVQNNIHAYPARQFLGPTVKFAISCLQYVTLHDHTNKK
jgi:hypothetical protein